jgi:putative phage-type endonuclease
MVICKKVRDLMLKPQPVQLSPEWFEARKGKITASSASCLLVRDEITCKNYVTIYKLEETFDYDEKCCNPYSSKQQYMFEKCKQTFKGSPATFWGQRYESIATHVYELMTKTKVIDFGLLAHPTLDWIAASPDGITEDGVMLEIKCPYRRKITGIPPLYYYQQVQIQLEVADLEVCDFLEVEFEEMSSMRELIDDSLHDEIPEYTGVYIQLECIPDEFEKRNYFYPGKGVYNNPIEMNNWSISTIDDLLSVRNLEVIKQQENYTICMDENYRKYTIKTVYWRTKIASIVRIERDRKWFNDIKDFLKSQWGDVLVFKENFTGAEISKIEDDDCLF